MMRRDNLARNLDLIKDIKRKKEILRLWNKSLDNGWGTKHEHTKSN